MSFHELAIEFATKKHEGQFRKGGKIPYVEHPKRVANTIKELFEKYHDDQYVKELKDKQACIINGKPISVYESIICAGVLHDTLEDTETTIEELIDNFGNVTAQIVNECTNDDKKVASLSSEKFELFNNKSLDENCNTLLVNVLQNEIEEVSEQVMKKRLGRSFYFIEKLNTMSLEAAFVKLSDRLDNVSDINDMASKTKPKGGDFTIEYKSETNFVMKTINLDRFTIVHRELISAISEIVK